MDKIKSNQQSFLFDKKYVISRDSMFDDDSSSDDDDKVSQYQMIEIQRRRRHFDEFRKMYNNKLEEREEIKKKLEEEKMDDFLQHPISKLLSKYGFQVPKPNRTSGMNVLRPDTVESKYSSSKFRLRNRSKTRSRSGILKDNRPCVSWSDIEIVDIYQRNNTNKELDIREEEEEHLKPILQEFREKIASSRSSLPDKIRARTPDGEKREDQTGQKLREEIAELEERFNCILRSFKKTFPRQNRTQFTVKSSNSDKNNI